MSRLPVGKVSRTCAKYALPSMGFFGGTIGDCLDLRVAQKVSSLEVRILSEEPQFLNLRGVLVKGDGGTLFKEATVDISQSSVRVESQRFAQTPHKLTGIHTLLENEPFWKAEWLVPQWVENVQIFNRADHLGVRARELKVAVTLCDGSAVELYNSVDQDFLSRTIQLIEKTAGALERLPEDSNVYECERWRRQTVQQVVSSLRARPQELERAEMLSLVSLLPTRMSEAGKGLIGSDFFLLAYILCFQVKQDSRARSGVAAFSRVLNSVTALEELERNIELATKLLDAPDMYLAKHGISVRTLGNESKNGFFRIVEDLIADAADLGVDISLAYGSLLGAVREGGAIPHDDDYDFFAPLAAKSHEEFLIKRRSFMNGLGKRGWKVWPNGEYMNFHVSSQTSKEIKLDIFAVHIEGTRAFAHMERAVWRDMPAKWFGQTRSINFSSGKLPAITHAEEFLTERYGPDWREPNKFHEWKWPLNDE